ncbi:NAD-dependent epimerase/dehydratase family protein [Flavivirga jejuensis]|uniref:NAD(P)-dependent oxidoreductase n=1 Tax=Flavivirga jejuensis TaxID=870487 RepID=A0ABT8WU13_9FLAO|nr:NAD(P)-dependent oxidoreductase [Flavivirga jejuensis]MDO5976658.1 NAD(P)-dependent oxidoreductase [Flavivirga jejuensis]
MKKKSHIIIGSNSFLGSVLSKKIAMLGMDVLGVYHENIDNLYSKIAHIPITKLKDLEDHFDVVYIISAFIPNGTSVNIDNKLKAVNVDLVNDLCKQFKSAKIVFCSSVSVYKHTTKLITEKSVLESQSKYAESKLKGEAIVKQHDKYAIVRISSIYGVHMKVETFVPLVIKNAIIKNTITLFGDGKRKQNYIHVSDVANYLYSAAEYNGNDVFLATSKDELSNFEVVNFIKTYLPDIKINFKGIDNSKSYLYDNSFTNKTLKMLPEKVFKKEVLNCIEWIRKMY